MRLQGASDFAAFAAKGWADPNVWQGIDAALQRVQRDRTFCIATIAGHGG
jgi:hypothetical protein